MMPYTCRGCVVALSVLLALALPAPVVADTAGTAFTYQGQLKKAGSVLNDTADFQFTLWDDDTTPPGVQVGSTVEVNDVDVAGGLFTVTIDFGQDVFTGDARWLEIAVRSPAGGGAYTTLTPRQELTPAPYALALPGVWTQQNATSPNIIGGHPDNWVAPGMVGATIGGGGQAGTSDRNAVSGSFATLAGGRGNTAAADYATVAGGYGTQASGYCAAVGGGGSNRATNEFAVVPGGEHNLASGPHSLAAGYQARASHVGTFVWADRTEAAFASTGDNQFLIRASGGVGIGTETPTSALTVNGWIEALTGGGFRFPDGTTQTTAAEGGTPAWNLTGNAGTNPPTNFLGTTDNRAFEIRVRGARALRVEPADEFALEAPNLIGGHRHNSVTSGVTGATIAGGGTIEQEEGIGPNTVTDNYGSIGGGWGNRSGDNAGPLDTASFATVAGGYGNTASGWGSTVAGGQRNVASGHWSTVSGGENVASGLSSTVAGGEFNTAGGSHSFAAGRRAKVRNPSQTGDPDGDEGTFIWADSTNADFQSAGPNQFLIRAAGGVGINTNSPTCALDVRTSGNRAIYGRSTAAAGTTWGAQLENSSTAGGGVYGLASGAAGATYGGYFYNLSTAGRGVYGVADAATGVTSGGHFLASSTQGRGVVGLATANTGTNYGVYGQTLSAAGYAGYFVGRGYFSGNVGIGTQSPTSPLTVNGVVESQSGGFKFPDGTTQASAGWSLSGNAGTDPDTDFLGTTDNQALEVRVNGARALRIEPSPYYLGSPNLIGGHADNTVTSGVWGATIAGGGGPAGGEEGPEFNSVTNDYGSIGGGMANQAGDGAYATVAGGAHNTASGFMSTVGGGTSNRASADESTVAGGTTNTASGEFSAVPGGLWNQAGGRYSFAAGQSAKVRDELDVDGEGGDLDGDEGTFIWADSTGGYFQSTGPNQFLVRATGGVWLVPDTDTAGGALRLLPVTAPDAYGNRTPNVVNGFIGNSVTSGVVGATIAGGGAATLWEWAGQNVVTDHYGTVGGGAGNQAGDAAGTTSDAPYATVSGGVVNQATGVEATVSGGRSNEATGDDATVAGGAANQATGAMATVSGGGGNDAWGFASTVGGGWDNHADGEDATVSGGYDNYATATDGTVGGGSANDARGVGATVPGGVLNVAGGDFSFAAGWQAKVRDASQTGDPDGDEGTFIWADSTEDLFTSTGPDQFLIRAGGGVGINTNSPGTHGLQVSSSASVGEQIQFDSTVDITGVNDLLALEVPATSADTFQFIECQRGDDREFAVNGDGDVLADGTYAGPADFAELITASTGAESVEPGDVLVIDAANPRAVVKSSTPRSTLVAGVYSTRPGFVGSPHDWDEVQRRLAGTDPATEDDQDGGPAHSVLELARLIGEVPVAMVGIVPCKVSAENGAIRPGDLLVTSSTPGHAMRDDSPRAGMILGKALGTLERGTGVVEVLVTLQ